MNFWQCIPPPIIGLAPMDSVTDASFRFITAKHGRPEVVRTEFVNIQSAIYAPELLLKDFTYSEIERPVAAQIYGKTPELFYKVAHIVGELGFDGLDINMGCPARKVAAAGCGAALIREPELARSIIQAARQGLQDWHEGQTLHELGIRPSAVEAFKAANRRRGGTDTIAPRRLLPLSIKTRIGYDRIVVEDWIATLLEERPAAITLHGRTLRQGYKGDADWQAIAQAAEIARGSGTLLLGNGDLRHMADVCRRVRETRVDGVLIGQGAQGNPWLFTGKKQAKQALRSNGAVTLQPPVSLADRFGVMLEHSRHHENDPYNHRFFGMRKNLLWYCRGFDGEEELRWQMKRANCADEVEIALENFVRARNDTAEAEAVPVVSNVPIVPAV
ncbi:MAG TPA: tRNA-dihydrouridine synthase [Candidatus Limnocylindria bacterium]|nr:tRNA-dihydrouridine synthase [Candidatus Limnocylindria bacterium]